MMSRGDLIYNERLKKLESLKKEKINPFPSKFEITDYSERLKSKFSKLPNEEHTNEKVSLAGRIMSMRDMGKIAFGVLQDSEGKIQFVLQEKETPKKTFDFYKKYLDSGDIIGIKGTVFRTKRGELSVLVSSIDILSKSLLSLPEKWHGLQDDEERLRKRYLDIIINPEVKEMFMRKSLFWNSMREFLLNKGFTEVETPVLETSAGGASATPFKTHHNALDIDVFLRISMGELWQKKLMVAGFGKTFEIGRQFRNEGMDAEHLQDYTQMEFYWAYADYSLGMSLVEELYKYLALKIYSKTEFNINSHTFDLANNWERLDFAETIKKITKIDISKTTTKALESKLRELKVDFVKSSDKLTLIDSLWKYCRKTISGPAFVINHPVDISPLAKRSPKYPDKVERFQVILGGSEVGNGYSELNDPLDQEKRFIEQQKLKEEGNLEAHSHDYDFVEALKYGMPPACGFGVSERLFAFLEGKPIRETVIFPLMRPK